MKAPLLLILFFMLLTQFSIDAQNTGKEQSQIVFEAIKRNFTQKMSYQTLEKTSRSALIIEPVRLEYYTYQDDPANLELVQAINSTWGVRGGKDVIVQDELDVQGNIIRFAYTFDALGDVTGATISVLLGPLPIPIGNIAIIKDSNGNITRAQVTVSFGGDDILEGDSTRFEYDGDQRITAAYQYFLDSEFGPDWILASSYTNIEYCIDESVCAYEYMSFGDNNELLVHERNSDLEWYGDYSNVFLKSLQAPTDFYLVNSPGLLLPADPLDDYLSDPIAGNMENVLSSFSLIKTYSYPLGSDEICVFEFYDDEFNQFFFEANCYLLNNDALERINTYDDEALSILYSTTTFDYNEFGFPGREERMIVDDGSGHLITNEFETDAGYNLVRLTSDYKAINSSGGVDFNFGNVGIYTPRNPVTSIKELNSVSSFSVFPNPAAEYLTVELDSEVVTSLSVRVVFRNLLGSICHATNASMENGKLLSVVPIGTLTPGVYIVEVIAIDGQSLGSSKFIKK